MKLILLFTKDINSHRRLSSSRAKSEELNGNVCPRLGHSTPTESLLTISSKLRA